MENKKNVIAIFKFRLNINKPDSKTQTQLKNISYWFLNRNNIIKEVKEVTFNIVFVENENKEMTDKELIMIAS